MSFTRAKRVIGAITVAWAACAAPAAGQQSPFPREHHAWGRFPAGSWKVVRTTSESLDEKGQVVNTTITDTRTTLSAVDESGYTLRSEVTVDVAGRRLSTTPHVARHGYYGETPGQGVSVKRLGDATVATDGRVVPCEMRQVLIEGNEGKVTSTLYYSADVAPFVLRRETSVEGNSDEKRNSLLVEVIALDLPQRVRGELREASYIKTTQMLPQGTKVTLEVHCDDVPGGVTAHWSSETDAMGRVVRRSALELIDFGLPTIAGEQVAPLPRRMYRGNKASRRMESR